MNLPPELSKYLLGNHPEWLIYFSVLVIVVTVYKYTKKKKEMRESIKFMFNRGERIEKIKEIEKHYKKELSQYGVFIIISFLFILTVTFISLSRNQKGHSSTVVIVYLIAIFLIVIFYRKKYHP